jgi:hypothetical protein
MKTDSEGSQDDNIIPPPPPHPTRAIPGTEAKIAVMENRVDAGCQPFHPLDYREDRRKK